jgi:hypothetical protein
MKGGGKAERKEAGGWVEFGMYKGMVGRGFEALFGLRIAVPHCCLIFCGKARPKILQSTTSPGETLSTSGSQSKRDVISYSYVAVTYLSNHPKVDTAFGVFLPMPIPFDHEGSSMQTRQIENSVKNYSTLETLDQRTTGTLSQFSQGSQTPECHRVNLVEHFQKQKENRNMETRANIHR